MTPALEEIIALMMNRYRRGRQLALLFDYDGTLVPIAAHPRLAIMPPRIRRLLRRLAGRSRIALGILSGRELGELETLVSLKNIYYAGNSGLKLNLRGTRVSHPGILDVIPAITTLAEKLQSVIDKFPGAWLESKMAGLTIHFRSLPKERIPDFLLQINEISESYTPRLRFTEGPKAIEIVPELGWDKGTAARFILDHIGQEETLPLYVGDAPNDDPAFEVVGEMGGICIGIGSEIPPFAHYCMADPAELFSFLAMLDKQIDAEEPGGLRFVSKPMALYGLYHASLSTYRM
jgi:trehalose 6-phosphate synthase/phosphatase